MPQSSNSSSANDLDFFFGRWRVAHRRRKVRLDGCDEWIEFGGATVVHRVLTGMSNVDDNVFAAPRYTYNAVTLRTFNDKTRMPS